MSGRSSIRVSAESAEGVGFRRAGITVVGGSAVGFGISLLLTPVISRLFSPAEFGLFASITAVVATFVGVSTLRLEVRAQETSDRARADRLLNAGLGFALTTGVVAVIGAGVVWLIKGTGGWWLLVGPLIVVASLQLLGSARMTRDGNYRALAVGNLVQGAGTSVVQVALGWLGGGLGALLTGFGSARLIWLGALRVRGLSPRIVLRTWVGERRYVSLAGTSALINSCASQLPVLMCAWLFGQVEVGFLAMAIRLLMAPLGVVGQAAAAATIGEVGRMLRTSSPGADATVRRGMRDLLVIGLLPCGLAAAFGYWLVPTILGDRWSDAGLMLAVLSAGSLAQFTFAPFSQLLNLTARSRQLLIWDCLRFLLIGSCFLVVHALGEPVVVAVAAYSIVLVMIYALLGRLALLSLRAVATSD